MTAPTTFSRPSDSVPTRPAYLLKRAFAILLTLCCFETPSAAQSSSETDIANLLTGGNSSLAPNPMLSLVTPPATPVQTPAAPKSTSYQAAEGPWGSLVGDYIYLEAPPALVETFALPSVQTRWTFPAPTEASLPSLLSECGLDKAQVDMLLATIVKEGEFLHILPPLPFVEQIPGTVRSALYMQIAKYPANEYHMDPVLIFADSIEAWYRSSKLRPELIQKIKQLSYLRGETTAFSDIPALLNYAQSDSEARIIFKACTRTRALMIRLQLDHSTNVQQILDYWSFGVGIRRKDIEPVIQSIIESDTLHDLGLSQILPAQPRKLLYTYPGLDMAKHGLLPDCHWTSLNFYNFDPHQYLLDSRLATSKVLENYIPVEAPYQFGDILFFLDNNTGDAFHSCIHLADTLVFTKNGRNILSPWVIMTIDDVKKIYLYRGNGRVQAFRRKDIDSARATAAAQVK
jgi:hypothetical protein